jgi:hypothetical protein
MFSPGPLDLGAPEQPGGRRFVTDREQIALLGRSDMHVAGQTDPLGDEAPAALVAAVQQGPGAIAVDSDDIASPQGGAESVDLVGPKTFDFQDAGLVGPAALRQISRSTLPKAQLVEHKPGQTVGRVVP